MKYSELSDQDKIRHIKNAYVDIVQEIAENNKSIDKFFDMMKDPVLVKPTLHKGTSPDVEALNKDLIKKSEDNFNTQKEELAKIKTIKPQILELMSKIKKKEDCICEPPEWNIDLNTIPSEFEVFIDIARQIAEERNY